MQIQNEHEIRRLDEWFREIDPIASNMPDFDDSQLVTRAQLAVVRINDILEHDPTLTNAETRELLQMGVDCHLDFLYAKHGGEDLSTAELLEHARETGKSINTTIVFFEQHPPQDKNIDYYWDLRMKALDLHAFQARGTHNGMSAVIKAAAGLMEQMAAMAESRFEDDVRAARTRGKLYELMLATYARMQTYEDDDFTAIFVRSALSREDSTHNDKNARDGEPGKKRNVDIVIDYGENKARRLIQVKDYDNGDAYAYPIEKIEADHFGRVIHNLPQLVKDFRMAAESSSAIGNPAYERLVRDFNQQLDIRREPRQVAKR